MKNLIATFAAYGIAGGLVMFFVFLMLLLKTFIYGSLLYLLWNYVLIKAFITLIVLSYPQSLIVGAVLAFII